MYLHCNAGIKRCHTEEHRAEAPLLMLSQGAGSHHWWDAVQPCCSCTPIRINSPGWEGGQICLGRLQRQSSYSAWYFTEWVWSNTELLSESYADLRVRQITLFVRSVFSRTCAQCTKIKNPNQNKYFSSYAFPFRYSFKRNKSDCLKGHSLWGQQNRLNCSKTVPFPISYISHLILPKLQQFGRMCTEWE